MALAAGVAFLSLFGTGLYFQLKDLKPHTNLLLERQGVGALLMVGLYAVDLMAVVMTVLTSVDTVSGELASGTIQAVATKPISRWELLLGKWMGFVGMVTVYVVLMVGGITAVTYLMSLHAVGGVLPHHLLRGATLIWLECILMLSLTFRMGASFSTLTNGVVVLGLHGIAFIGGWIEQAAALTHSPRALNVGIIASLIMPSEALWRRAVFEMQSPIVSTLGFSPFSAISVPSKFMILYACLYLAWRLPLLCAASRNATCSADPRFWGPRYPNSSTTCALVGAESPPPMPSVASAPAALAKRAASPRLLPWQMAAKNAAAKQSPAPVVSTGCTGKPGEVKAPSGDSTKQPLAPSLTMTVFTPRLRRRRAIAGGSLSPVSCFPSSRLGKIKSVCARAGSRIDSQRPR